MSVREMIRRHIAEQYLNDGDAESFGDDADLLERLDSLQILRMLIEFEARFGIRVDNSELTPENLGSVNRLAAFIEQKRHGQ